MSYGERIKRERERRGLTQEELAKIASISQSYLGDIERGKKSPSIDVFKKISQALSRPIDFFITESGDWESQINRLYLNMIDRSGVEAEHKKVLLSIIDPYIRESIVAVYKRLNIAGFSVLKRRFYKDEREIFIDGRIERELEVELEILGEEAQFYAHRYIQSYDYRGTGYNEFDVKLVSSELPTGEAQLQIGRKDTNLVYYRVMFFPPLRKDAIAKFKLHESYKNAHIMTRDRLLELMGEGKLMEERPVERSGSLILYPTEKLVKRIIFPKGYEIKVAYFDVAVNRVRQIDERSRLIAADSFKVVKVNGKWVCELVVDNALMGCNYFIFWEPPSAEECQKL